MSCRLSCKSSSSKAYNAETLNGLQGCSRAVPMESLMPAAKSQIACEQINIDLVDWDAFFYGAWIGGHR